MKKYYGYYLIDPNTNEVRYVGITHRPKIRLNEHIRTAKKKKSHKDKWILCLLNNNQLPIFKIICESESKEIIIQFEKESIVKYNNLTNSTTGGEYFTFTSDVIEKLKEINKGVNNPNYGNKWNENQREKQSLRYKNRKLTDSWKEKISKSSKNKKPITINGITYSSITEAVKKLNISWNMAKKLSQS